MRMDTCIYMSESLLCSPEMITTLFVNQLYTPILKFLECVCITESFFSSVKTNAIL